MHESVFEQSRAAPYDLSDGLETARDLYGYNLTIGVGTRILAPETTDGLPLELDIPIELTNGNSGVNEVISYRDRLIVGLQTPGQQHNALDYLLTLENIRRKEPEYEFNFSEIFAAVDQNPELITKIIEGNDEAKSLKALRYAFGRTDRCTDEACESFEKFFPHIAALSDPERQKNPEAKQLYNDMLDAFCRQFPDYSKGYGYQRVFFDRLADNLGYEPSSLQEGWEDNGKTKEKGHVNPEWARRNIKTMLEIESIQPGLCSKITETFRTCNFARRSPQEHIMMYEEKIQHPDKPYVLSLVGREDPNLTFSDSNKTWRNFAKKARLRGLRIEEYECASTDDIDDIAKELKEQYDHYGSQATDMFTKAHGTAKSIVLNIFEYLDETNVARLAAFKPVLAKDARILLGSCSSAYEKDYEKSIGRRVAVVTGHRVKAPTRNVRTNSYYLKGGKEQPYADISFTGTLHLKRSRVFTPNEKIIYPVPKIDQLRLAAALLIDSLRTTNTAT